MLREYARIALPICVALPTWWSGVEGPEALSDADAAAIPEITTAGAGSRQYRVELYDKNAALDTIARHLGTFVPTMRRQQSDTLEDLTEDAREVLARRLARLAAGGTEE